MRAGLCVMATHAEYHIVDNIQSGPRVEYGPPVGDVVGSADLSSDTWGLTGMSQALPLENIETPIRGRGIRD